MLTVCLPASLDAHTHKHILSHTHTAAACPNAWQCALHSSPPVSCRYSSGVSGHSKVSGHWNTHTDGQGPTHTDRPLQPHTYALKHTWDSYQPPSGWWMEAKMPVCLVGVCVCLSTTQVKRWVVNKELVHCVSVCVWWRERERGKGKKRKITQFPKYWIPVWWDKSGYNSLFGLLVVHGILAQWPRFEASYSKCVCVCPCALFPKDLANGTVPRSALVLDAGSAALLRIFLHGISPDVLTIKGQQNADCKEKAMSRRKGYWYFRSSWLREWEWEGGRDGERRRGREESKERERRNRTRELFLSHKPLFCEYMWVVCVCVTELPPDQQWA